MWIEQLDLRSETGGQREERETTSTFREERVCQGCENDSISFIYVEISEKYKYRRRDYDSSTRSNN